MNTLNVDYANQLIDNARTAITRDSIYKLVGIKSRMITLRQDLRHDLPASLQIREKLRTWMDRINDRITRLNRQQVEDILDKCDYALKHAQQIIDHPDPINTPGELAQIILQNADLALLSLNRIEKTRYLAFALKEEEFSHRTFTIKNKARTLKENIDELKHSLQRKQETIRQQEAIARQRREEEKRQAALLLAEEHRQQIIHQTRQAQDIRQQLNQALAISNYDLARTLLYRLEAFDPDVLRKCFHPQDAGMQVRRYQDQIRALARERANGAKVPVL